MERYSQIRITKKTKDAADKLAKKFSISLVDLFDASMVYFQTTGVDPRDKIILAPADELKKLRNTLVSFIRRQEADFILPVFNRVDAVMARFMDYVENEAPRQGGITRKQDLKIDLEKKEAPPQEQELEAEKKVIEVAKADEELQEKYDMLKGYLVEVMGRISYENVNFKQRAVINMPAATIKSIQAFAKTL